MSDKMSDSGDEDDTTPFGNECVDVFIGPKRKKFLLHKNQASKHSEYFRALFNNGMTETESKEVHLDDVDATAFAVVVKALYADGFPVDFMKHLPPGLTKPNELTVLFNCYVAFDRAMFTGDFKDAVCTHIGQYIRGQHYDDLKTLAFKNSYYTTFETFKIDSETIILGLNILPDPDPVRLLLVDLVSFYYLWCDESKEEWFTEIRQNVPDEVTTQLCKNLREAATEKPVPKFLREFRDALSCTGLKGVGRYCIGYNTPK